MAHFKKHNIDSSIDHVGVASAVLDNILVFDGNGLPKDGGAKLVDLSPLTHNHIAAEITDFSAVVTAHVSVAANTASRHTANTDTFLDFGNANQVTALEIRTFIDSKGVVNGLAALDGGGKVPTAQLPASIVGAVSYKGSWDASTNSPLLSDLGVGGAQGEYYVVSVAGVTSVDTITDWQIGDWIIHNGVAWEKIDNTDSVASVNAKVGTVVLNTDDISEGALNLYYTEARVDANVNVSANTAVRHTQNSDSALRTNKLVVDASGNTDVVGELSMKVYSQALEPTLTADNRMAMWINTSDLNATYLIFRRGVGDQIAVELTN